MCRLCLNRHVGVLLVFEAAPGGVNCTSQSGSSTGEAELWSDEVYQDLATKCLMFIAEEIASCPEFASVIGLQICNEVLPDAPGVYDWYSNVIDIISSIDSSIPVYINDACDPSEAILYAKGKNVSCGHLSCPVVVDTHGTFTYSKMSDDEPPRWFWPGMQRDLEDIKTHISHSVSASDDAVAVYIGEYSCALPPHVTVPLSETHIDNLYAKSNEAQSRCWQEIASGAAFYTWKSTNEDNSAWEFSTQVYRGTISAPSHMTFRVDYVRAKLEEARGKEENCMESSADQYCKRYEQIGKKHERSQYIDGWRLGWMDGRAFFSARLERYTQTRTNLEVGNEEAHPLRGDNKIGVDKIGYGMLGLWLKKRVSQKRMEEEKLTYDSLHQWEEGFHDGINAF